VRDYSVSVAESLQHTPNLLELELLDGSAFAVNCAFWADLTHNVSSPCLVPKLRRIKVTRGFEFDYSGFVDMVASRWRGTIHMAVERIQSVKICLMQDHEEFDMYNVHYDMYNSVERLRQFRAEGLNVIAPDIDREDSCSGSSE
jgi:hypothetical protein